MPPEKGTMFFKRPTTLLLVLATLSVLFLGCSAKPTADEPEIARRKNELNEIYDLYTLYAKNNQKPPKQLLITTFIYIPLIYELRALHARPNQTAYKRNHSQPLRAIKQKAQPSKK